MVHRLSTSALALALALAACKGNKDEDSVDTLPVSGTTPGTTGGTPTGTPVGTATNLCGNDALDPGEDCDFGAANASDGNCLPDCTLSDTQYWTISLSAFPTTLVDAVGASFADAPLGSGAWQPADSDLNGDGLPKVELNMPMFDPRDDPGFFLLQIPELPLDKVSDDDHVGIVTVADIASITFDARHPAGQSPRFYLYLYTQPDGVDDGAAWYGYRLYAYTGDLPTPAADTWGTYSTNDPTSPFGFWDTTAAGGTGAGAGATLAELTATTAFDWSAVDGSLNSTSIDYGAEAVKYVSIQTSSGTGTTDFDGAIDNVLITLTDGRSFQADLEP